MSFGEARWAEEWVKDTGTPFPLFLDPTLAAYRAFGLGATRWRLLAPSVVKIYAKALLTGRKVERRPKGDPTQLGGDFVLDESRRLLFAHFSSHPADRPDPAEILKALDNAALKSIRS